MLLAYIALLCLAVSGCGKMKAPQPSIQLPSLVRVSPTALPILADDMVYDGLLHGMRKSLLYLDRIPVDTVFRFGEDRYGVAHMQRSLTLFARPLFAFKRQVFEALNYLGYRFRIGANLFYRVCLF